MFETFRKSTADKVNLKRYEVLPALEHLQQLNDRKTKASKWMRRHEK